MQQPSTRSALRIVSVRHSQASTGLGARPKLAGLGVGVLLFALGAPVAASPDYPGVLQSELAMSCPPPCTICHADNSGGLSTVLLEDGGKAFGDAMINVGDLEADDTGILRAAIATLERELTDSDGDGISDIEALRADQDPNVGGNVCGPKYGCGATIAKRRSLPGASWYEELDPLGLGAAGLLVLGLGWLRRRRAR